MDPQRRKSSSLSPRSIKTRFAIRFLRSLRKISNKKCTRRSSYHKIKTAADSSMAYVVGPRRAWSRAMLARLRWRRSRSIRIRAPVLIVGGKRMVRVKKKGKANHHHHHHQSHMVFGQEEQLRKLVPGGEVMDTCNLLDETAHYIKCLSAQVTVMRSIVNYCSTIELINDHNA